MTQKSLTHEYVKFEIKNLHELQDTFANFFRTMGEQMSPDENCRHHGYPRVSLAMLHKIVEMYSSHKGFFDISFRECPLWEFDLENQVVTIPVEGKVSEGLLEAIEFFEDEDNRVIHPARIRAKKEGAGRRQVVSAHSSSKA